MGAKRTRDYVRYEGNDSSYVNIKGDLLVNGEAVAKGSDLEKFIEHSENENSSVTSYKNADRQKVGMATSHGVKSSVFFNDTDNEIQLQSTPADNQYVTVKSGAAKVTVEDSTVVGVRYEDTDQDVDIFFNTNDLVGLKNINDTIDGQLDSIRETIADNKTEVDGQITSINNKLDYQAGLINGVRTEVDRGWDSQANYVPDMIRSSSSGELVSKSGWCVSDFLSVEVGHQYSFYVNQRYDSNNFAIFYDKDKNLVRVVENTINSPYGQYPLFNHAWITVLEGEAFMTFCDKLPTSENVANLKVMHRTSTEPSKDYWLAEMPTHHNGLQSKQDIIEGLSGKKLVFNADGTVTWINA